MGEQVVSWLIILAGSVCSAALYTNEPPVKLLSVGFFANRFPAPDSKYRTSISQGEDVPAVLGPLEEANGMPDQFLILMPGGCASYELPAQKEEDRNELYLMVQPGKKQGKYFDYKDKADISLKATFADMPSEIDCSVKSTDGSPQPSDYCMLNISSLVDNTERILGVELCVPAAESRSASLWELWVSPEDDSRRAKGTFEEEGRQRLRLTQEIEDFNKNLTMASVVGHTGVGKSTVASFLAGNMSMFTSAAAAEGTTTIGTDMSPIIPSDEYIKVLNEKLQEGNIPFNPDLYEPNGIRPLIIMDSEGMSFRGDEFDFITSGPAAIIAKTIVWITTDRIQPSVVLEDIRDYLKGLDRISMGGENVDETPSYGEFVIVLNKMQSENISDEELLTDLMGYTGNDAGRETIEKLQQKFEDVSVVGLPFVHVNVSAGEELGYSVLPERFREGLSKLANHLLYGSETPRIVNVGNQQYEMNSTEAIPIVAMLTDAANSGNIDLSDPCNVMYSIFEERVSEGIISVNKDIESHLDVSCSQTKSGIQCSECACKYRNALVELTTDMLLGVVKNGVEDADLMCEDISISNRIKKLENTVNNWNENNHCDATIKMMYANVTTEVCDISEMVFENDQDITKTCSHLFLCGDTTLHNSGLNITIKEDIFVDSSTTFTISAPPDAREGRDGGPDSDGEDGEPGERGKSLTLRLSGNIMKSSATWLVVKLVGGKGGDGGDGGNSNKNGIDGIDGIDGVNGQNGENGQKAGNGSISHLSQCKDLNTCDSASAGRPSSKGFIACKGSCPSHTTYCGDEHRPTNPCTWETSDKMYTLTKIDIATCPANINGDDGGDSSDGQNGTDGTDGGNGGNGGPGGNGGKGGCGGEAGYCVIESNHSLGCIAHRSGGQSGKGGSGGEGGIRGIGGKKGKGGSGGRAGEPGVGGSAGYAEEESRTITARMHFHSGARCGDCQNGGGIGSIEGYTCCLTFPPRDCSFIRPLCHSWFDCPRPCRHSTMSGCEEELDFSCVGHGIEIAKSCEGVPGNDGKAGRRGQPGLDGADGDAGLPGKRGENGEDGKCMTIDFH